MLKRKWKPNRAGGSWLPVHRPTLTLTLPPEPRMLNLELLSKYGSNSWLIHNYQMEGMVKQLQQDLEDHRKKVLELNKVRKYDQISQGNMLQSLELRWSELIGKIISLESAILGLEAEVEDMEQQRDYLARNARTN